MGLKASTLIAERSSLEEGPETMESGRQNDHEGTTTTVDETCADVNLFAQETNVNGT